MGTHIDDPSVPKDLEKNLLNMQRGKYKGISSIYSIIVFVFIFIIGIFPQLEIYFRAVSCATGEGIDVLRKEIQTVSRNM